jgi:hypothetical protein
MAYATVSAIQARLPGRTLTTTSKPTTTQMVDWVSEGDALLDSALASVGITVPVTEPARALLVLRSWSLLYSEGHTRRALASAGGDSDNDDGKDLLEQFSELLAWIRANPADVGALLSESGEAADSARRVRGYVIDNDDNLTIENGDFAPVFTKAALGDQF